MAGANLFCISLVVPRGRLRALNDSTGVWVLSILYCWQGGGWQELLIGRRITPPISKWHVGTVEFDPQTLPRLNAKSSVPPDCRGDRIGQFIQRTTWHNSFEKWQVAHTDDIRPISRVCRQPTSRAETED